MSESGQNEGQEQDKNTPFFDSAKITDKKDVEHFANVEGAEERARKAEQAKKAAEKEAQEVHAADVRAASEQLKKQENGGKKGGIVGFLFGGWHKIVTIVVLLILVAGGIFLAIRSIPESEEAKLEKDKAAIEYAQNIYTEAEEVRLGGSYDDAKKKFEDALVNCSREEKIFITIKYAEYIAFIEYDAGTANLMIDEIENMVQTDIEKEYINTGRLNVEQYSGVVNE